MMAQKCQYSAVQSFEELKKETYAVKKNVNEVSILKEGLEILTQAKQSKIFYYLYYNSPEEGFKVFTIPMQRENCQLSSAMMKRRTKTTLQKAAEAEGRKATVCSPQPLFLCCYLADLYTTYWRNTIVK